MDGVDRDKFVQGLMALKRVSRTLEKFAEAQQELAKAVWDIRNMFYGAAIPAGVCTTDDGELRHPSFWIRIPRDVSWPRDTPLVDDPFDGPIDCFVQDQVKRCKYDFDCDCMRDYGEKRCDECCECLRKVEPDEDVFSGKIPANYDEELPAEGQWTLCRECCRKRQIRSRDVPRELRLKELADKHDVDHLERWLPGAFTYRSYSSYKVEKE